MSRVPRNTFPAGSRMMYGIWKCMNRRCHNPEEFQYKNYGARGIKVCPQWRDTNPHNFFTFLSDIPERPSKKYSLDRKDNNKGYSPDNIRWATQKEQTNNMRKNVHLTFEGETRNITQWAELKGIKVNTLQYRLRRGWSVAEAITGNRVSKSPTIPMRDKVGEEVFIRGLNALIYGGETNETVAVLWDCDNSQVSRLKRCPKVLAWWEENK